MIIPVIIVIIFFYIIPKIIKISKMHCCIFRNFCEKLWLFDYHR